MTGEAEVPDEYSAYTEALFSAHETAINLLEKVTKVEDESGDEIFVAMMATLIEYANTGLLLASKKTAAGDDSVFRSFLEAFVDLKNLSGDAHYKYVLLFDYHDQWRKLLKSAAGGNPYLEGIAADGGLDERIGDHEQQLRWLKRKNIKPLNKIQKFKKAEMEAEYRSIYNFSSGEAHNNMRALFRRNLDFNENGWVVRINQWSEDRCIPRFDAYAGLLIRAAELTNLRFALGADEQIEGATQKLSAARKLGAATDEEQVADE